MLLVVLFLRCLYFYVSVALLVGLLASSPLVVPGAVIVSSDRVSSSFVCVVLIFSCGLLFAIISASVVTIGGIVVPGSAVGT